LLLKEESHFDKITDPSAGSYYIENLTFSLAQQAWKLFLETEETGFYQALKLGKIQDAIDTSAQARAKALANRKEILLGTNQYPNFSESMAEKMQKSDDHSCGCSNDENTQLKKLNMTRLSDPFDTLRLATERSGKPRKYSCLPLAIWLCARHAHNFRAISSAVPVMRLSTILDLTQCKMELMPHAKKMPISLFFVRATMNMPLWLLKLLN
jgi:methylmalonyl-CoA mutase N-terminal domain/subunit